MSANAAGFFEAVPPSVIDRKAAPKRVIQWDEATLAEHDKERGTRQKIDEPPTPFNFRQDRSDSCESEGGGGGGGGGREGGGGGSEEHFLDSSGDLSGSTSNAASGLGDVRSALDWSTLHAKLNYEQHLRSDNIDLDGTRDVASVFGVHNQPVEVVFESEHGPTSESESTITKHFKDKRNAHYNEFKVIQALRRSRASAANSSSGDEED